MENEKIEFEKAAAVSLITRDTDRGAAEASLDELERLLETAGGEAAVRMIQVRPAPEPRTYIGSGKLCELRKLCRNNGINLVVFDADLSPAQIKNIEDELNADEKKPKNKNVGRETADNDIEEDMPEDADGTASGYEEQPKYMSYADSAGYNDIKDENGAENSGDEKYEEPNNTSDDGIECSYADSSAEAELLPDELKKKPSEDNPYIRVIDRSMLILDIFALHAVTNEGKLQVELAQLKYTVPRLIGKGLALSRQQGGNIAMRGPGESKLESDRRHLKRRMYALEQELKALEARRATQRKQRDKAGIMKFAIAGYTNAGKSTLLNYLTGAGILAEDKLFATLDPTTRKFRLPSGQDILLIDTVGFIRNLPHHLIKAFKSTLDEVSLADAVIVMIDASDPENAAQLEVTRSLLTDLDAADKPVLYVYNKCDLPADIIPTLKDGISRENILYVSARTGEGIDKLVERIGEIASSGTLPMTLRIPLGEQSAVGQLYRFATVQRVEYTDGYVDVDALCDKRARGMFGKWALKSDGSEYESESDEAENDEAENG